MSTAPAHRPPDGLTERGRAFWDATVTEYELTPGELHLLAEVCRTLDDLDRLATMVATHGASVVGSKGQPVVNPALTEARGQRLTLHRLIAALQLPDPDAVPIPTASSIRGRTANRARWTGGRAG